MTSILKSFEYRPVSRVGGLESGADGAGGAVLRRFSSAFQREIVVLCTPKALATSMAMRPEATRRRISARISGGTAPRLLVAPLDGVSFLRRGCREYSGCLLAIVTSFGSGQLKPDPAGQMSAAR